MNQRDTLDIVDLEAAGSEEAAVGTEPEESAAIEISVIGPKEAARKSVYDRLYTSGRSESKVRPGSEDHQVGGTSSVNSGTSRMSKFSNRVGNSTATSRASKPRDFLADSPRVGDDIKDGSSDQLSTESPAVSNVYDRLYKTSTKSRIAQQKSETTAAPARRLRAAAPTEHRAKSRKIGAQTNEGSLQDPGNRCDDEAALKDVGENIADETEEEPVMSFYFGRPATAQTLRPTLRTTRDDKERISQRRKTWHIHRIPSTLVERTSLIHAALPVLPIFLSWLCLIANILVPGTGTILSGLLCLCFGAPRFSPRVTYEHRLLALIVNCVIGIFQAMTILFCLVGWCWALAWGIILVNTSSHYRIWKQHLRQENRSSTRTENHADKNNLQPPDYHARY